MRRLVAVALASLLGGDAVAGVTINEIFPDPAGADAGLEWVELYNDGASAVDLSGWKIEAGTRTFAAKTTLEGVSLAAGDWLLVGEDGVAGADVSLPAGTLDLGNAGTSADAVRLVDASGATIDTLVYGAPNSDGWIDDSGAAAESLAPKPVAGRSIARSIDGVDTDASAVDFAVVAPTPGASNYEPPPDCASAPRLVVNELMPNPAGADADSDGEWVELFNGSGARQDLAGWTLEFGTSTWSVRVPLSGQILAGGWALIGEANVAGADVTADLGLGNASGVDNSDAVRLEDPRGCVVDTVVYGSGNKDAWVDDTGSVATSWGAVPKEGETIGRAADGADTDVHGVDIVALPYATPGRSNTDTPDSCGGPGSGVVVNEVMPNPPGSDIGLEWVELYHAGAAPVDLSGWTLQAATTAFAAAHTFADGSTLNPRDYLVVGGASAPGVDVVVDGFSLGNASGSADGVRLVDCNGFASDTVVYGSPNDDALVDDTGAAAVSTAPNPGEGQSIARLPSGADTNDSAFDFAIAGTPTPGADNGDRPPCVPSTGAVLLNEILPDPDGQDAGLEWIELYNAGTSSAVISAWSVAAGTSDFEDVDVVFPATANIPAGGYFVVGGELVDFADLIVGNLSIGNASSTGDGVRLFDCTGAPVDTVVYGPNNDDGLLDDDGLEALPAPRPGSSASLARRDDGADSNEPDDWYVDATPSPGETNFEERPDTGGDNPGGCNRQGAAPEGEAGGCGGDPAAPDEGGCATMPLPLGGLELVALLGALLRRRRP